MARTPRQTEPLSPPAVNTEVLAQDMDAHAVNVSRLMEIDAHYSDGLPYDRDRLVNETRFLMAQSAEAMLEAGKRLILIKEHELHGDFTEIVEGRLGLASRTARVMMQAALKYCSPKLDSKRQALAVLGKTKLFELMVEDDDELEALAEGGTVQGLSLDDIDRMSARELKAALRKQRQDAQEAQEIAERQIAAKDKKINELDAKLSKPQAAPEYDEAEALRALDHAALEAVAAVHARLRRAATDLMAGRGALELPRTLRQAIAAALGRVRLAVADLGADLNIAANESAGMDQGEDGIDAIWAKVNAEMDAKEAQRADGHDGQIQ